MPRPVSPPIHLSTTFHRAPDGSYEDGYVYSRADNPNRRQLETELARLEGGTRAFAFASGMGAAAAALQCLEQGDHVLLPDDVYYAVRALADEMQRWGLTYDRVDMTDHATVRRAIRPNTRLVWIETPSNPQLKITDVAAISKIARGAGARVIVDNTWPTPVLQRPFELGADLILHSTTKYCGGHSDVLGGALVVREEDAYAERLGRHQTLFGGVPSPFDCWLVLRGLHSLELRVRRQSETALAVATFLDEHPDVSQVNYPGLPSSSYYELAMQQMRGAYGAMLSARFRGGEPAARRVANALQHFAQATSLGGVESLVEHRKSVEGPESPTPDDLLRFSIGLEEADLLVEDLRTALKGGQRFTA